MSVIGTLKLSSQSSPTLPRVAAKDPELPLLPKIQSEQLLERVFTRSVSRRDPFQSPTCDASADHEELGHIGDQAFMLAMTDIIQDRYPYLKVGPASKLRDEVKCGGVLAEICVSYNLHERLRVNLPEHQARELRDMQSVQVDVFKAYVGGVYRDQGLEVLSRWLNPLFQSQMETAYQNLRRFYLLPTETSSVQESFAPTHYPSLDAGPALPNHLAEHFVPTRLEITDRPNRRRRRSASPRVSKDRSTNAEGSSSQHLSSLGGLDITESVRKRARSSGPDGHGSHSEPAPPI